MTTAMQVRNRFLHHCRRCSTKDLQPIPARGHPHRRSVARLALSTSANAKEATTTNEDQQDDQQQSFVLYNSLTFQREPIDKKKPLVCFAAASLSDRFHVGRARAFINNDIFRRVWEQQQHADFKSVLALDDLPATTRTRTRPPQVVVVPENKTSQKIKVKEWWRDWDGLGLLRPHKVMRISVHVVPTILPYLQQLVDRGWAYPVVAEDDNDDNPRLHTAVSGLYFHVQAFDHDQEERASSDETTTLYKYGHLAMTKANVVTRHRHITKIKGDALLDERLVDPRDFLLWQATTTIDDEDDEDGDQKSEEDSKKRPRKQEVGWESPWGRGLPTLPAAYAALFHSAEPFPDQTFFSLRTGYMEDKFPHHVQEMAVMENNNKHDYFSLWMHHGATECPTNTPAITSVRALLRNKNKKNKNLLHHNADALRWWCLRNSYRDSAMFGHQQSLYECKLELHTLQEFLVRGQHHSSSEMTSTSDAATTRVRPAVHDMYAALHNDLDGTACVEAIQRLVRQETPADGDNADADNNSLSYAVASLRDVLRLLGLSESLWRAGLTTNIANEESETSEGPHQQLPEVEEVLDTLAQFHANMREMEAATNYETAVRIREICQNVRKKVVAEWGIELLESTAVAPSPNKKAQKKKQKVEKEEPLLWRRVPPPPTTDSTADYSSSILPCRNPYPRPHRIPPELMFRVGPEALDEKTGRQYSQYDAFGIPTHHGDGTRLSNRLVMRLTQLHRQRRKALDKRGHTLLRRRNVETMRRIKERKRLEIQKKGQRFGGDNDDGEDWNFSR